MKGGPAVHDHISGSISDLDRQIVAAVPPGGNWRSLPEDFPSKRVQQIRDGASKGGGSRSTYYGRLQWERPAYTINTYITRPGNGCFIHPKADRLITVREAARLQTFPDSVHFEGTIRSRCVQVGNAVPPLLAYHLGLAIPPGTAVDLFAGAGGLGFGLALAGHRLAMSTDINADACKTLSTWAEPGHEIVQADISDERDFADLVDRTRLMTKDLDLVVGGAPCQGFSTAGACRIADPRNRLVLAFLRFVEQTRPARVLFENVPALRWRGHQFLDELCDRLVEMGYETETAILHAEAYGVPQLRRRLLVQASLAGAPRWPDRTHVMIEPAFPRDQPGAPGHAPVRTVRDAIGDLPVATVDRPGGVCGYDSQPCGPLQRWLRGEMTIDEMVFNDVPIERTQL